MRHPRIAVQHGVLVRTEGGQPVVDEPIHRLERLGAGGGETARSVTADERHVTVALPAVEVVADLVVDPLARRVLVGAESREVAMTGADFDLLLCFVTRPQRVLSREQLLDWTRGRVADVFDRTIDVQVSRLRKRLEESGSTSSGLLKTVRNAGYILSAPVVPG